MSLYAVCAKPNASLVFIALHARQVEKAERDVVSCFGEGRADVGVMLQDGKALQQQNNWKCMTYFSHLLSGTPHQASTVNQCSSDRC